MSNTYKVIIAAIAIAILGATSIFLVGQKREQKSVTNQSSSAVSSVKSLVVSSSMQSQIASSVLSSSQVQISSSVKAESEVVVSTPNIEFLDSNNPPQYIKDYLACETKDITSLNGSRNHISQIVKETNSLEYNYRCPPKIESLGCNIDISFVDKSGNQQTMLGNQSVYFDKGWNCDVHSKLKYVEEPRDLCRFYYYEQAFDNQNSLPYNQQFVNLTSKIKSVESRYIQTSNSTYTIFADNCIIFTNSNLNPADIEELKKLTGLNQYKLSIFQIK